MRLQLLIFDNWVENLQFWNLSTENLIEIQKNLLLISNMNRGDQINLQSKNKKK